MTFLLLSLVLYTEASPLAVAQQAYEATMVMLDTGRGKHLSHVMVTSLCEPDNFVRHRLCALVGQMQYKTQ